MKENLRYKKEATNLGFCNSSSAGGTVADDNEQKLMVTEHIGQESGGSLPTAGAHTCPPENRVQNRIVVSSETKNLGVVRDFLMHEIRKSFLQPEDQHKVIQAVDEAVSNVIEHSYEYRKDGLVHIDVDADPYRFKVTIRDTGKNFQPANIKDPNILEHVKKGRKKGLGIFLMRQIMDEVRYTFKEGKQNELVLVKYVARREDGERSRK